MTLRDSLIEIGADELRARGVKAADDPLGTMEAIADRLGLDLPERRRAWLFVRQTRWVSPTLAGRAGGAIVATRTPRGRANRSRTWYMQARTAGAQIVTWEWMLRPGRWRQGLEAEVAFAASIGAVAICLNAEPASKKSEKGTALDWRGQHAELDAYASTLRDLCDLHGLEFWVTGWALPSAAPTFPWLELLAAAHVCIPQPYEVHGRAGPAYVAQVLREWREYGARRLILGRGAHELDRSDRDSWRTATQLRAHRRSSLPGLEEAWWLAQGEPPAAVVAAMLEPMVTAA